MSDKNNEIKDRIIISALEDVPFDGWTWDVIERASETQGFDKSMAFAVFPEDMEDVLLHFSQWADQQMITTLNAQDFSGVRDVPYYQVF